jgi:transcriptional antiterminator NusG
VGSSPTARAKTEKMNNIILYIKESYNELVHKVTWKWFSLRVISGKEKKIKERLELEVERSGWGEVVGQIIVPSEKVYKIRKGKKVILERNILPGYILIEADEDRLKGEIVRAITNVPNVMHFLGRNNPIPMTETEANRMLGKVDESKEIGESLIEPFLVGESVKITDGPFNGFVGDILEVNDEKKKLKIVVKIFGRGTEVELNYMQVEKQ